MYLKELVFLIFQDIRSGASAWSFDSEEVKRKLGTNKRFDEDVSRIMSICYNEDDLEEKIQSLLDRSMGFKEVKTAYLFSTIWNPSYKKICIERTDEFSQRGLAFICFYATEDLIEKVLG